MRRSLTTFVVVGAAGLAFAGSAEAGQRYVAPTGAGVICTQVTPCSVEQGVNSASSGDEVIVTPGTYTTSTSLVGSDLNIHGVAGQPRPTINSNAANAFSLSGGIGQIRDLTIRHSGAFSGISMFATSGTIERVDVESNSFAACSVGLDFVFRDSLCVDTNPNGAAFSRDYAGGTTTAKLRNLTLIATGGSGKGIIVNATGGGINSVDAKNVIAQGGQYDVLGTASGGGFATITLANSNYDVVGPGGVGVTVTAAGTGTNQTAAAVFADTTSYHQAPASPTINAGTSDPDLGTTDLDGDARTLGSAPDIGADELVPAVTPPPGDTTPPETTITKGPRSKTTSKKATFRFSSSESGSTFVCALDGNVARPCISPLKLSRVTKGRHKLTVVATDAAGNADATPATYKWKVKKKRKR